DYRRLFDFRVGLSRYLHWSEARMQEAGITTAQYQLMLALRQLSHGEAGPTTRELAQLLHRSEHALCDLAQGATGAGLIERLEDAVDRRLIRLVLTPAGESCLADLVSLHATAVDWHPPSLTP
ncbi:MAG: MarR family winged helix-turn-helix transcriptional regulator, partial [Solirubrobacteraceae bacterium]